MDKTRGILICQNLSDRIGLSANGMRQFCRTERVAYDQTGHSGRTESVWTGIALSSAALMRSVRRLADPVGQSRETLSALDLNFSLIIYVSFSVVCRL